MAENTRPPIAIRIVRPYETEDAFLESELETVGKTSVILIGAHPRPTGVILRFEVTLASGAVVLRGEGRVLAHKENAFRGQPGLALRFTRLDPKSKALVDKGAAIREARLARDSVRPGSVPPPPETPNPPSLPVPPPAETPNPPSIRSVPPPETPHVTTLRSAPPPPAAEGPRSVPPPLPEAARRSVPPPLPEAARRSGPPTFAQTPAPDAVIAHVTRDDGVDSAPPPSLRGPESQPPPSVEPRRRSVRPSMPAIDAMRAVLASDDEPLAVVPPPPSTPPSAEAPPASVPPIAIAPAARSATSDNRTQARTERTVEAPADRESILARLRERGAGLSTEKRSAVLSTQK